VPKPNYASAKRQRELTKQQRKQEKRKKKEAPPAIAPDTSQPSLPGEKEIA